jgi:hypothetical protein
MFIVGFIFTLFGAMMIFVSFYYRVFGKSCEGQVIGYQKARTYDSQKRRRQTLYYPLIEYFTEGTSFIFKPYGSSEIGRNIGEKVKLLKLSRGPQFVSLKSGPVNMMSSLFFFIGLILIIVYLFSHKSIGMIEPLVIFIMFALFFIIKVKRKITKKDILDGLLKAPIVKREDLDKENVLWTQSDIENEISKNYTFGFWFSALLMLGSFWGLSQYLPTVPSQSIDNIKGIVEKSFSNPSEIEGLKVYLVKGPELISGILILFCLMFTYSFLYSWKRMNRT